MYLDIKNIFGSAIYLLFFPLFILITLSKLKETFEDDVY